jgi:hypothetical protein
MGIAEFGGDGSVQWDLRVSDVRAETFRERVELDRGTVAQQGVADTPRTAEFTITIKVPESAAAKKRFAEQLRKCVDKEGRVTLRIPVEPETPKQVVVAWPGARGRSAG